MILLRATTPDAVFLHSGFVVESMLSMPADFGVRWQIISFGDGSGIAGPVPLVATAQIYGATGPLAVGTYHVTVDWQDAFGPLIDPAVHSAESGVVVQAGTNRTSITSRSPTARSASRSPDSDVFSGSSMLTFIS